MIQFILISTHFHRVHVLLWICIFDYDPTLPGCPIIRGLGELDLSLQCLKSLKGVELRKK
ncbi:e4493064-eb7d-45c0-a7ef-ed04d2af7ee2 [Sclerotinia trifoliorum]|uniref:E4493064-eb7d-45c0-a7ef-ed04d2af7ee2 n=1 Tax=Sclerotinia trifoliorum TaxID=28548 RepID=A0A8H2VMU6_9HELO|nr:e4493064-eb7d-45c0-a7ef-ed04d2af7ee2 [Sclerotinia trifoliorum]